MKQEDKELLLKDLCARLPYGVKIYVPVFKHDEVLEDIDIDEGTVNGNRSQVKPYLRSMSSMTEEEVREIAYILQQPDVQEIKNWLQSQDMASLFFNHNVRAIDWLNAHHFDYRGLVEKGFALEAPEGMYNIKKNKL